MNILVTGCSGFIGSALVQHLNKTGHTVYGCSRRNVQNNCIYRHLTYDLAQGIEEALELDVIIHTAAQSPSKRVTFNDYYRGNIKATELLLEYARQQGVKKIIYLATVSSYGAVEGVLTEDSSHVAPDDYGLTKYIAEKLVRESGIPNRILVLPSVTGAGCRNGWLVNTATQIWENQELSYYNPDALFNNIADVDDVCAFIARIIKWEFNDSQTYILATRERWRVKEVLEYLVKRIGSGSRLKALPDERRSFYIDCSRALENGFEPKALGQILDGVCEAARVRGIQEEDEHEVSYNFRGRPHGVYSSERINTKRIQCDAGRKE